MFILVPRAAVSSGRIREVLETEPSIHDPELPVVPAPDGPDRGVVEFRDVEFRYPGAEQPVLRGISFRAAPGQTTAIVGSTGSGKSTLINLIPRFYDATSRHRPRRRRRRPGDEPRRPLGADRASIPQKAFLFSGTVAQQPPLRRGRRDRRGAVAGPRDRPGQATSSSEMEGGLDAPITQGGTNVSGGQRQRLVDRPGDRRRTPRSTSSTTASPRSTSRPTRGSGPRSSASSATRR